jgi:cation diffusion facilitator CzcD-associated flavoprotein CzcO
LAGSGPILGYRNRGVDSPGSIDSDCDLSRVKKKATIIGAGPAGLTAAYELLCRSDVIPVILGKSSYMGGISRTVNYKGNRIDLGGPPLLLQKRPCHELVVAAFATRRKSCRLAEHYIPAAAA